MVLLHSNMLELYNQLATLVLTIHPRRPAWCEKNVDIQYMIYVDTNFYLNFTPSEAFHTIPHHPFKKPSHKDVRAACGGKSQPTSRSGGPYDLRRLKIFETSPGCCLGLCFNHICTKICTHSTHNKFHKGLLTNDISLAEEE